MSDDKRNHPRAKVLSMTVRYKSATVDDFVEHHSDNVSRGGIFIKTASPFPPGTLLKFEIRIADDEAVLAGVGRVVWKRDEPGADEAEDPAGMGVKFIKLDEKSRALIARLVDAAGGKESKYDKGFAAEKKPAKKAQKKSTLLGLGAIGDDELEAATDKAKEETAKDASPDEGGFFPSTTPEDEQPPPEERTVMKQAAELLEQALAGAGGSMEELGTPDDEDEDEGWGDLDAGKKEEPEKKEEPKAVDKKEEPKAADKKEEPKAADKKEEPKAADKKEEPKPAAKKEEPKPAAKKEEPKAAVAKAAPRPVAAREPEEEGGGKGLPIILALAVLGVLAYLFMSRGGETPETTQATTATTSSAAPSASESAAPEESASAAASEEPAEEDAGTEPATSVASAQESAAPPPPPPPVRPPPPPPVRPPPPPPVQPPPVQPPPVQPPPAQPPPPPPPPPPAGGDDIYD